MARTAPVLVPQSAALPFRFNDSQLEILLITAARHTRWIIPKGHLEPFMDPADSAAHEAYEEAGVQGMMLYRPIGHWYFAKKGTIRRVEVYPMMVETELPVWPEADRRKRRWVSLEEADMYLGQGDILRIVRGLPEYLESWEQVEARAVI